MDPSRTLLQLARQRAGELPSRPVAPNQNDLEISRANVEWAVDWGLAVGDVGSRAHAAIRTGSCSAHAYPTAPKEVVRLGADLISWLFLFDDRIGECPGGATMDILGTRLATYDRALRDLKAPRNATAFHRSLVDLGTRGLQLGGARWFARFADAMASYYEGCLREVPYRSTRQGPSLEEYRDLRSLTVGMYPVFSLIELATGQIVDDDEACRSALRETKRTAALLCAWVNDIYSFSKESLDGDPLNVVSVVQAEYSLTCAEGLAAATEIFHDDLACFEDQQSRMRRDGASQAVIAYLVGLEDWIFGNRQWTATCGRYV